MAFLYKKLATQLRESIQADGYEPGQRLPSYNELSSKHGVSLITIRRAVKDLIFEGVLEVRHGSGLYVATPKVIRRELGGPFLIPLEQTLKEHGYAPSIREVSADLVELSEPPLHSAGTFNTGFFHRIERVNLADNEPLSYDCIWISRKIGKPVIPHLQNAFIFSALAKSGVEIMAWDYQIACIAATEKFANMLEVPTSFPLIKISYFGKFKDLRAELFGETIARSDRFIYSVSHRPVAGSAS